ncbi:MAG TPA: hypothetical protein VJQ49_03715 [Casimicrobiaceae bacterium]|nr:hypothetical protein [Casimicrobiaceae bacterium]
MSVKSLSLGTRLAIVAALAVGVSGTALAEDSSMNPFTGEFYRELHDGRNLGDSILASAPRTPTSDPMAASDAPRQRHLVGIGRRLPGMPTPIFSDKGA